MARTLASLVDAANVKQNASVKEMTTSSRKKAKKQQVKAKLKEKSSTGVKAKYLTMISDCILKLESASGSSRAAILNQLKLDYSKEIGVNEKMIGVNLSLALKHGLKTGVLKMAKKSGKGSGSFKLTSEEIERKKQGTSQEGNKSNKKNFFVEVEAVDNLSSRNVISVLANQKVNNSDSDEGESVDQMKNDEETFSLVNNPEESIAMLDRIEFDTCGSPDLKMSEKNQS